MPRVFRVSLASMLLAASTCAATAGGPAIGQFELKDLEAGAGYLQFQSQNAYSWGEPRRKTGRGDDGELIADENTVVRMRNALEMEMGFTRYLKSRIGIEFEKERIDDPATLAGANDFDSLKLSEIGGEIIGIMIPRDGDGFGLGAVVEIEHPLGGGEENSVVMGPIFELASGPWFAAFIPMGVHHFGGSVEAGEARDEKWDFAYAAQLLYAYSPEWSLGVEAYGTVDRIAGSGHPNEANEAFGDFDQHRLGPIVYYTYALPGKSIRHDAGEGGDDDDEEGPTATFGLGFFAGLNENTPDGTLKASLEVDF